MVIKHFLWVFFKNNLWQPIRVINFRQRNLPIFDRNQSFQWTLVKYLSIKSYFTQFGKLFLYIQTYFPFFAFLKMKNELAVLTVDAIMLIASKIYNIYMWVIKSLIPDDSIYRRQDIQPLINLTDNFMIGRDAVWLEGWHYTYINKSR